MSKYDPLHHHLANISSDVSEKTLTFDEINEKLSSLLPVSAYIYSAWWANQTSYDKRPQAKAWLKQAGK